MSYPYRRILEIELTRISPPKIPLRRELGDIQSLARSIEEKGLLVPIVVNKHFEIVHGQRRYEAVKSLGRKKIECQIRDDVETEQQAFELALTENFQRKNLTDEELASSIKKFVEMEGWGGQTRLAKKLGVSIAVINQIYGGHKFRESIPEAKNLPASTAYTVSTVKDESAQKEIAKAVTSEDLSRVVVRQIVKDVKEGTPVKEAIKKASRYNRGVDAPKQSDNRRPTHTDDAMALFNLLAKKFKCETEEAFAREGEKTREGKTKTFHPDILVNDKVCVEVEGAGSSSKDNPERDEFFVKKGLKVLHIPNGAVREYPDLCVDYVSLAVKCK